MLLLVTLALVLASAVLLILGFVQDALGFIYLSMLCAGVAALALFVFARLARRRGAALAGAGIAGGSSPYLVGSDHEDAPAVRIEPDVTSTRQMAPVVAAPEPIVEDGGEDFEDDYEDDEPEVSEEPILIPAAPVVRAPAPVAAATWADDGESEDWGDEIMFPIEDYDDLRVAEILPLLAQLDPDELQEVRDREVSGKSRNTILDRIDDRLGRRPAAPAAPPAPPVLAPEPVVTAAPAPARGRAKAASVPAEPAPAAPAKKATAGRKAAAPAPAPVPRGRKAAAAPEPVKAPAATRKATGTAARKATGPAAKAVATSAAAGKASAKKAAPVKAVATKAAPAKAAPAKKAAATKAAAPAKKATKAAAKKR